MNMPSLEMINEQETGWGGGGGVESDGSSP